jgi:ubiquinone/menaquinone biosynthesis C-methylase UbiE
VAVYDDVAGHYDATRGGERRGDEFAAELDDRIPPDAGLIVEVGVGTGVVALGLRRRGRAVIGVDIASSMLARAYARLGPVLVRGDSRTLPLGDASVSHAVSVWVVHAVEPPEAMFCEVARVLRPGGRYFVCPTNRAPPGDVFDPILTAMFDRAEEVHPTWRQRQVVAPDILDWGKAAGFVGRIETFKSRTWSTRPEEQIQWIRDRVWPALRGLDERSFRQVTQPALDALGALPDGPIERRAEADVVVLALAG